jgi:solute carrier family 25 folate transporter 32
VRGFYRGLIPSLIGISHVAIQFPLYERLKLFFSKGARIYSIEGEANHVYSSLEIIFSSVISKIVASTVTYPHEVIRTRLQNQTSKVCYGAIWNIIKAIYREEGIYSYYRGMTANILRAVPGSAVSLLAYEMILAHLLS